MKKNFDDGFLYRNRPPLRKGFADRLYRQITESERQAAHVWQGRKRVYLGAVGVLLALALVMLFVFSSEVRAGVLNWVKSIGGLNIEERTESPFKDIDETQVTVYPVTVESSAGLLQHPPFDFAFPDYVPEGYELREDAGVSGSWVSFHWENEDNTGISLLVEKGYNGFNIPAGVDSAQAVQINGEEGVLIVGAWNVDHLWDPERGVSIYWLKEGLRYALSYRSRSAENGTIQPIEDVDRAVDVLLRMAESFQEP